MANKAKIGAAIFAAALVAAVPFIGDREGESLQAYKDSVGVWTVCRGETMGVSPEDKLTKQQCDLLTQTRIGIFMSQVVAKLAVPLSPETLAAHTSFAYNIGLEGYGRSTTLRLTNAGEPKNGCYAMMKWITAGGRDCSVRSNNCYGLFLRRQDEVKLCLQGVK